MSESSIEINLSNSSKSTEVSNVEILLIEDDLAEARLLQEILKNFNLTLFNLTNVNRLRDAFYLLQTKKYDVILLDLTLPDSQGLESVKRLVHNFPNCPIVVLTNTNDDRLAIEAVRQGAQDYLVKRQINIDVLVRSIQYAIERQKASELLRETNERLTNQIKEKTTELMKAKEIDRLKSELVSMFSHDLKNPLTTVLSCAELLQHKSDLLSEEKKTHLLEMLRYASKEMGQLLDEVLLVGCTDSGTLECHLKKLDLKSFCLHLVDELQINADRRNIKVNFSTEGKLKESLWDKNLLRHIIGNLLANAIKYSPDGSEVDFKLIAEDKQIKFIIRDWGIGIPPEDCHNLFEPFHRASNVGRTPGTGLGLAIVKSCVETHKGNIEVSTNIDLGTTFTVTIPQTMNNE